MPFCGWWLWIVDLFPTKKNSTLPIILTNMRKKKKKNTNTTLFLNIDTLWGNSGISSLFIAPDVLIAKDVSPNFSWAGPRTRSVLCDASSPPQNRSVGRVTDFVSLQKKSEVQRRMTRFWMILGSWTIRVLPETCVWKKKIRAPKGNHASNPQVSKVGEHKIGAILMEEILHHLVYVKSCK